MPPKETSGVRVREKVRIEGAGQRPHCIKPKACPIRFLLGANGPPYPVVTSPSQTELSRSSMLLSEQCSLHSLDAGWGWGSHRNWFPRTLSCKSISTSTPKACGWTSKGFLPRWDLCLSQQRSWRKGTNSKLLAT